MDLSIVVVNYRSWEPLSRCLASIQRTAAASSRRLEATVVDNASNDGGLEAAKAAHPGVRFVASATNDGFGCANDRGAAGCTGRRLLFLNPDTELPDGELDRWLDAVDALPSPSVSGCRQIGTDGTPRKVHDVFPGPWDPLPGVKVARRRRSAAGSGADADRPRTFEFGRPVEGPHNGKAEPAPDGAPEPVGPGDAAPPVPVDWITGAALLIDRSLYDAIGGWGDAYWLYSEDVDLCRRAHEAGARVWYVPAATIRHDHGGATRRDARTAAIAKAEVVRSRHVYVSRRFRGLERLIAHALLAKFRLLGAAVGTAADLLTLHTIRGLRPQPRRLAELLALYAGRLTRGTWRSPRLPPPRIAPSVW